MMLQWRAVFCQTLMGLAPTAPFQAGHGMARSRCDLPRHKKLQDIEALLLKK